jgi:di/tricarboxylate transporter
MKSKIWQACKNVLDNIRVLFLNTELLLHGQDFRGTKTIAGAQLRLMLPIGIASAFLNNTSIVAVMIPLTLRWAKNNGMPRQQLLIPLSYATISGVTCKLVGTSTNLVVAGLLNEDYPGTPGWRHGFL